MIASRLLLTLLALLALATSTSALPRSPRSTTTLHPHHLRIAHLLADTHPHLVVDSPHPHFTWQLQPELSSTSTPLRGVIQTHYQLQLLTAQLDGSFALLDSTADSGRVQSNQSTQVLHSHPLQPMQRYLLKVKYWSSTGSESEWAMATFRTSMFDTWRAVPAKWIGSTIIPMHQLKRSFSLPLLSRADGGVVSASVQMSGIGYSTLLLNGQQVDPSRKLDPGWTTYQKRTLYVVHDVAEMLDSGENVLAVELGNGWYSQEQYITGQEEDSYGPPRLWLWLHIQFADNSTQDIYSDETWQGATGPTIHDGVYMGSILDNRWLREGWAKPGVVDPYTLWINATTLPSPLAADGVLSLQIMDPIRTAPDNLHIATSASAHPGLASQPAGIMGGDLVKDQGGIFHPAQIANGVEGQPMDMGQNMAGWCTIKAKGKRGMSLMVRYSETMNTPGNPQDATSMYTENLRTAACTDIFIFSKDDEVETFEPPFTIHGFRYIEFRGAKYAIAPADVECHFVHSETTMVGNFTSANGVMNQIQHNIQWGQLSNLMSLPTDCPQRDERKGWMGDAGLTIDESLFNFDTAAFYINFLNLIRDIQTPDGALTDTVPLTYGNRPADPNWGTAYPQIVWTFYQHYGDVNIVRDHYKNVKAWVDFVHSDYHNHTLKGLNFYYGDWVPPPPHGQSDQHLIAAFPFVRDVSTIVKMATLLNDTQTVTAYQQIYNQLTAEFHTTWWNSTTYGYADGMQTANALALALPGVVPANLTQSVVEALVKDIFVQGHLTTGIVGVAQLFPVLSANGHHDTALFLAQSTSYPSYGWMFTNAIEKATTLWELWDSPMEGPSMNSRNHIMFGSIGAWFYRDVAGINLEGVEEVRVRPRMGEKVDLMPSVHAEVVTVKGAVVVDYVREGKGVVMTVQVPENMKGRVEFEPTVKGGKCVRLEEGGVALMVREEKGVYGVVEGKVQGVEEVMEDEATGVMSVKIGAGVYEFTAQWQ